MDPTTEKSQTQVQTLALSLLETPAAQELIDEALSEVAQLEERAERRQICFETNIEKLVAMRDVKKGTRYRHWLFNQLEELGSGTPLQSEEYEYSRIGKFHRGIFANAHRTFKTKKESLFIYDIAKEYGAFDY
jgi:hypothetical protein